MRDNPIQVYKRSDAAGEIWPSMSIRSNCNAIEQDCLEWCRILYFFVSVFSEPTVHANIRRNHKTGPPDQGRSNDWLEPKKQTELLNDGKSKGNGKVNLKS